jgi:hypothetical protein
MDAVNRAYKDARKQQENILRYHRGQARVYMRLKMCVKYDVKARVEKCVNIRVQSRVKASLHTRVYFRVYSGGKARNELRQNDT